MTADVSSDGEDAAHDAGCSLLLRSRPVTVNTHTELGTSGEQHTTEVNAVNEKDTQRAA